MKLKLEGLYDNRSTMKREWYSKGKLIYSIDSMVIYQCPEYKTKSKPCWGAYPDLPNNSTV